MSNSISAAEPTNVDDKIWNDFETQLDNIFLVLSSSNPPVDSDAADTRHGVNERHMSSLLDACRALDCWFIRKRFQLCSQCPGLSVQVDTDAIQTEVARKEKVIAETKAKLRQYCQAIALVTDQVTKDLSYQPQQ